MIQTRLQNPPVPEFVAVPRRASSGGWTVKRQQAFIAALAACGSVAQAAAAVGMSKTGVYLLRNAKGGDDFRRAWDAAIENGVAVLKSVAFERAVDGIEETVSEAGKPVRIIRRYDNRLLVRLLAIYETAPRAEARAAAAAEAEARAKPQYRIELVERFKQMARRIA
ncbi:MAG: hypothetical protein ACRCUI_00155, partial [Polymorphobacter sp.]